MGRENFWLHRDKPGGSLITSLRYYELSRIRQIVEVTGIIQGVGFRPALVRLATKAGLAGWAQNRSGSVRIALEGAEDEINDFLAGLPTGMPPNAKIKSLTTIEKHTVSGAHSLRGFSILESSTADQPAVTIPADLAACAECIAEVVEPGNRRYGYPFTTCTNCGPRYTIVNSMPYDRKRTTMSAFPMCDICGHEYEDPGDRRFHAETIACPDCGPKVWIETGAAAVPPESGGAAIQRARLAIAQGKIVAIRGIGGFLLAADPFNRDALRILRERKKRPHKPFAIMAANLETLGRWCVVTPEAEELLVSAESPIVILDINSKAVDRLPIDLISPDTFTVGSMLPTSPLHKLMFAPLKGDPVPAFELLIMTSGNRRGEPTCISNEEAGERLGDIADLILCHDREINLRNDDSLCVIQRGVPQVWRRARGYAPNPVHLAQPLRRRVLAMGAEIKNTIAVGFGNHVVISPHVGDLETPEAIAGLEKVAASLPLFLNKMPEAVAVDLHPDMRCTVIGRRIASEAGVPVVEVQHHHAHAAACLAEHGLESGLALVFDGTGLGTDGSIWGAELLEVGKEGCRRLATFAGAPLPGGDAAVRQPARQLVARWAECGIKPSPEWLARLKVTEQEAAAWVQLCAKKLNAPITHAAGRVFDSFSALLGFAPDIMTYEGQPAIRLETAANQGVGDDVPRLPFACVEKNGLFLVDWRESFEMLSDLKLVKGREAAWAMSVHHAVAEAAVSMVQYVLAGSKERTVALSGGVFMNRILNVLLVERLEKMGLKVVIHRLTPPNDGCISLGQAVVAGMKD
jgi:hydrogenase maturation protein HypF